METVNVTIRLDKNIKKEADSIFSDFGMSFNTAVNLFIRQTIREQKFLLRLKEILIVYLMMKPIQSLIKL